MIKGLFVGLTGLDITYYQNEFPSENLKSKTNDYQTFVGGPAANAAITYSILGGNATLITCLGETVLAKTIKSELEDKYHLNVVDMAAEPHVLPSLSSILVNKDKATRTIWSGQRQFKVRDERLYDPSIEEARFCFSDCNLPEVSVNFLRRSRELNKTIVLDPGSWKSHFSECLHTANEVIASVSCQPPDGTLLQYLKEAQVDSIGITDGEKDTLWYSEDTSGKIKVPKVSAVDTLAAGDVLHGAYCYYRYHEGLDFVASLEKATIVASESVKYHGAREGVYHVAHKS